jgi:hypothetical protein
MNKVVTDEILADYEYPLKCEVLVHQRQVGIMIIHEVSFLVVYQL